ncbi:S-layer homology domain-containing protein [Heliorestis acidaminivorans]|nr:S-layer homology domain-containing protein [Heliorestis acidaminivorans]
MQGYPDGTFAPLKPISRAETSVIIDKAKAIIEQQKDSSTSSTKEINEESKGKVSEGQENLTEEADRAGKSGGLSGGGSVTGSGSSTPSTTELTPTEPKQEDKVTEEAKATEKALTQSVSASEEAQSISHGTLTVTIPAGLLEGTEEVTIAPLEKAPSPIPSALGEPIALYDVTIGALSEFTDPIALTIPYDPSVIPEGWHPQEVLSGLHWDEKLQQWHQVPIGVNEEEQKLTFYTKNLSPVAVSVQKEGLGRHENAQFRVIYNNNNNTFCPCWADQEAMAQDVLKALTEAHNVYVTSMGFKEPGFMTKSTLAGGRILVFLGNFLESEYSPLTGYIYLSNIQVAPHGKIDLKHEAAHEYFHAIQNQYFNVYGLGARRWWVEATADYAAGGIIGTRRFAEIDEKFFNHPLYYNPDIGDQHKYQVAQFIDYLVQKEGVNFKALWDHVAERTLVYDNIKYYLSTNAGATLSELYRNFARYTFFSADSSVTKAPNTMGTEEKMTLDSKVLTHNASLSPDNTAKLWIVQADIDSTAGARSLEVKINKDLGAHLFVDLFVLNNNERLPGKPLPLQSLYKSSEAAMVSLSPGDSLYVLTSNGGTSQDSVTITIRDANVDLTINPAEILDAEEGKEYTFNVEATNLPESVQQVAFSWNAGTEREDSTGEEISTVQNGNASARITYQYKMSPQDEITGQEEAEYTFSVNLINQEDNSPIMHKTARVIVKTGEKSVSILPPRIITYALAEGATEAEHTFEAHATPEGEYRFEWDFDDGTELFNEVTEGNSKVNHTYKELGIYSPTVKIYNEHNILLAEDSIKVILEVSGNWRCPILVSEEELINRGYSYDSGLRWKSPEGEAILHGLASRSISMSGANWETGYFNLGERCGTWTRWYDQEDGKKSSEWSYKNGKMHGTLQRWYENGTLSTEEFWNEGQRTGTWTQWFENGEKWTQRSHNENGQIDDIFYQWHADGSREESTMKDGSQDGLYRAWYPNGNLSVEGYHHNGRRVCSWTFYKADGTVDYKYPFYTSPNPHCDY